MKRETRQLKATRAVVAVAKEHLTAEQVYHRVRRRVPDVSLGTVYRNLDKLREEGRVRLLQLDGGATRYDPTLHEHDHFVCDACAGVTDLTLPGPRAAGDQLARGGFVVRAQATTIYGLCRSCAEAARGPGVAASGVRSPRRRGTR